MAKHKNKLIGVLALWDQAPFKQTKVSDYHPILRHLRLFYNLYAKAMGKPSLVKPGNHLNFYYASLVVTKDNNPSILQALLCAAVERKNIQCKDFIAIGLHEHDPFNEALHYFCHQRIDSNLYLVDLKRNDKNFSQLKDRIPYLELGSL